MSLKHSFKTFAYIAALLTLIEYHQHHITYITFYVTTLLLTTVYNLAVHKKPMFPHERRMCYYSALHLVFLWCLPLAVDCGRPQPLRNGSIIGDKTVYPNYVNHACDEGFILRGFPKIKCQTNGTWSRTSSFCEGNEYVRFCFKSFNDELDLSDERSALK